MITNTPLSGGYGCVDIPGAPGAAIRLLTRSKYSHTFIILDARRDYVLQSSPHGGAEISTDLWRYRRLDSIYSADVVLGGDTTRLFEAAQAFVGIPYGFLDIAYLGIELSTEWQWPWLLDKVLREDRMICSQLVAAFGVKYGANSWKCGQEHAQLVTPGMLASRAGEQFNGHDYTL